MSNAIQNKMIIGNAKYFADHSFSKGEIKVKKEFL